MAKDSWWPPSASPFAFVVALAVAAQVRALSASLARRLAGCWARIVLWGSDIMVCLFWCCVYSWLCTLLRGSLRLPLMDFQQLHCGTLGAAGRHEAGPAVAVYSNYLPSPPQLVAPTGCQ